MSALTDDYRMVPVANERGDRFMGDVHQRTRRIDNLETEGARPGSRALRSAVRRHHGGPRPRVRDIADDRDAPRAKILRNL